MEGSRVAVDSTLAVNGSGVADLTGATGAFSGGSLSGDTLAFAPQTGIAASYDATTGTLTLSGDASVAAYQTELDSISFASSATDATNGSTDTSRTITWSVSDAQGPSATAASTIDVLPPAGGPLTASGNDETVAAGTAIPLSQLFTFAAAAGSSVAGFDVEQTSSNGGYLTDNGVRQTSGVLYDGPAFGIPIGQWAFVAGPAGATDTIGFNVDESNGLFSPTADATVTATDTGSVPAGPTLDVLDDNPLALAVGRVATITANNLDVSDTAYSPSHVIYAVVRGPSDGTLLDNGAATIQFTQAQIDSGAISYQENGGPVTSDQFSAMVTDPAGTSKTVALQINVATACFTTGTTIATDRGETPVEHLRIGDRVIARGLGAAPIRWLGHRRIECRRHPRPHDVWPVRITAGAFAANTPQRDLLLSPDHAVAIDGVLIPIRYLLNGATIAQEPCDHVTYWHVKLAQHDILLAEGLACESYLDTGNRAAFDNGGGARMLEVQVAITARYWRADGLRRRRAG